MESSIFDTFGLASGQASNMWRAPWKNRIYWYISFFPPITCSVSDVLFTGGRGV